MRRRMLGAILICVVVPFGAVSVPAAAAPGVTGPVREPGGHAPAVRAESLPLGAPAEGADVLPGPPAGADRPLGAAEGGGGLDTAGLLRTLLALGLVIALAVGAAAVMKALSRGRGGLLGALGPGGPSPSGLLEIIGRYPVGSGQTLVLLRLDRRVLLLHQAGTRKGASMRTLAEVSDADEVASILMKAREEEAERVNGGFREAMRRLETDFAAHEPEPPAAVDGGDAGALRERLARWTRGGAEAPASRIGGTA